MRFAAGRLWTGRPAALFARGLGQREREVGWKR